ncbi:sensor histidine kinase [Actinocatenispora rupis]|uniref:sensor histidine kinase n=1 Tax=Actinocatenispora rupis TaxID=519421 RepID=UPI001EF2C5DB|nr:sensor histidine kinase [Actinocatenispora rupis]
MTSAPPRTPWAGRTVRSLGYLASAVPVGIPAFAWFVASVVLVGLLSLSRLGPHAFLASATAARALAGVERRRADRLLRHPVASPYVPLTAPNVTGRARQLAGSPATWRDAAWLALLFPLSLVCLLPALACTLVTLGLVTAPAWLWAVPNPNAPWFVAPLVSTWPGRCVASLVGVALAVPVAYLVVRVADGQVRFAGWLLGIGAQQALAQRLVETRVRVVDAQAAELRRIERDLHDGAQARIVAAGMTLALAERKLRAGPPTAADDVRLARRQLDDALAELRRLVRGIHPPILTDRGLAEALSALAADSPLAVDVHAAGTPQLPAAVESAAYFVVAEALTNAAKHADATSCRIDIHAEPGLLTVRVRDDGRGGADPAGAGLDGLRRRAEALGGTLTVTSPAGGPTVVLAELPCAS